MFNVGIFHFDEIVKLCLQGAAQVRAHRTKCYTQIPGRYPWACRALLPFPKTSSVKCDICSGVLTVPILEKRARPPGEASSNEAGPDPAVADAAVAGAEPVILG